MQRGSCLLLGSFLLSAGACAGPRTAAPVAARIQAAEGEPLVGPVSRAQIEALPRWRAELTATPASAVAAKLAAVAPGADVTVYLGTWCGDSRREVTRFFLSLDMLGQAPPFTVRYVAVDRGKAAPGLPPGLDLRYVPTFVVSRGGREVGRVVESAPGGIEADVLALLSGDKGGVLSGRADLGPRP